MADIDEYMGIYGDIWGICMTHLGCACDRIYLTLFAVEKKKSLLDISRDRMELMIFSVES